MLAAAVSTWRAPGTATHCVRPASFNALTTTDPAWAAVRAKMSPVIGRSTELVADRAQGSWVYGTDGRRYLDFGTGIAVCNTGHCHPAVVKALQHQATQMLHAQLNNFWHKPMFELVKRLQTIVSLSDDDSYYFTNSGAEIVEAAIKIARQKTGRTELIAFKGAFHGRTMGATALTSSKSMLRAGYAPWMPGVHTVSYPICANCTDCGKSGTKCCDKPFAELEMLFYQSVPANNVAAIFIEPILGEGGYVVPPDNFMAGLRRLCDKHGILLIFDEVQSGIGRAGKWFAHEWWGVKPDILLFAKGIASGMPLSGLVAPRSIMNAAVPYSHGGTYGGNIMSCAAAVATLDAIMADNMIENARVRGAELMTFLGEQKKKHPRLIEDVRGRGLMIGLQLDRSRPALLSELQKAAFLNAGGDANTGLLLLSASLNTMRLMPPLNIKKDEVELFQDMLARALDHIADTK